jgi:hypothetical protein
MIATGCVAFFSIKYESFGFAEIYDAPDGGRQLRIPHRLIVRGSPHNLFDATRREYVVAKWIPIDRAEGRIELAAVDLLDCPLEVKTVTGKIPARGVVLFAADRVTVDLEIPTERSKSGELLWGPFELNGDYRLERPLNSPLKPNLKSQADCRA